MKTEVSEATGPVLDWMVNQADVDSEEASVRNGFLILHYADSDGGNRPYAPSTDWSQGGPIIARERICTLPQIGRHATGEWYASYTPIRVWVGPTPLIAAMRCFVASRLGDEVEVPNELA